MSDDGPDIDWSPFDNLSVRSSTDPETMTIEPKRNQ